MLLPFVFLTLAIVLLWVPDGRNSHVARHLWLAVFIIAVGLGLHGGQLDIIVLIPVTIFGIISCLFERLTGMWRLTSGITIILFSLAFGLHLFPGFHNPVIVEQVLLGSHSLPYTLRFNFDTALVGLFILRCLHPLVANRHQVFVMLKQLVPAALVTLVAVITLSFLIGYIGFDIKFPGFIGYWLWANLFFVCMAEEALFRGFLQRQLGFLFAKLKYGALLALVICALLFGIAHAAGGIKYVVLATVAGLGYGWAYHRTQRIEASILLHFVLNSLHILFFSYPALIT